MNQSLAQFVAASGGVRLTDPVLQGELDRVRYLNRALRGRHSVLRTSGRAIDVMALDCIDAGYPIHESNFLEALEADARAWSEGRSTDRVWIDYELSAADLDVFDIEFESFLMERHETRSCAICGRVTTILEDLHGEHMCETCCAWAQAMTGTVEGCETVHVLFAVEELELFEIGAGAAMYGAIEKWLTS